FQKDLIADIKIAGKLDERWKLSIAVRNDEPLLLGIFEKLIGSLSEDTKQKILNKHLAIKYEKGIDHTLLWEVLSIVFIILIVLWYRHVLLKRSNDELDVTVKEKTQELQELNGSLEKKIESRTHLLAIKAHRLNYLLDNASQGFLSFGIDFLIEYEYSIECEKLLERDLNNKDISTLLFKNKPRKVDFFKETMIDAYNAKNELTSALLLSLLPQELIVNRRALQLEYKILSNNKFMLILTNITEKKKLQVKIKNEQELLKMIVSIVSDHVLFYETKISFESFCNESNIYINFSKPSKENAHAIYILIHTFKGIFAQLYMKNMVKKLHDFESLLVKFIDTDDNDNEDLIQLLRINSLNSFMDEDLDIVTNTLGESFLKDESFFKINKNSFYKLESKLKELKLANEENNNYSELLFELESCKNRSLKDYLSIYPKLCQQLCQSLNKGILVFEISGDSSVVVPEFFNPFLDSLIHIFRNCCEHGIETKERRLLMNKSELGVISCSFKKEKNFIYMEISDDGSGIDLDLVKEKALQKDLITREKMDALSEHDILNYLFDIQFSTQETVSELSGRGVGLAAVKKTVEQLNGSIEVKTKKDKGTSFMFKLALD
ncbi:MAG: hypothetical protein HRT43_10565, partial [Campylobacteraceae bacterium]|nr:hypothetical protein [Campylobacteraceae bacterium]